MENPATVVNLDQLYWFIGFLLVTCFGTICGAIAVLVKMAFWAGGFKQEHEQDRKDLKAAHDKIRALEKKVYEPEEA
jgi:hypothetical protein